MAEPTMSKAATVPIIGGGPAGMSCALWLANYGLRPIIIERAAALGGIARDNPYPNEWFLGRPGETGRENAAAFVHHIEQAGIESRLKTQPVAVRRGTQETFVLDLTPPTGGAPQSLPCPALVIATGTSFRGEGWLDSVVNARALQRRGRVHLGPTWAGERDADLGSHVAVIGGGDNAFDVSRMLIERGIKATIVMRAATPRAQPLLVERLRPLEATGMAQVMARETVDALEDTGGRVRLRMRGRRTLDADHVLVLFGYEPNSRERWINELALAQDPAGYLIVDGNMETSCPGIFAVGDIANPVHPCIAAAVGSGAAAGRAIQRRLSAFPSALAPPPHQAS